jgi:predicted nucleic acid-binding protein
LKGILIDSNILLDVLTSDPQWQPWSAKALTQCINEGDVYINAFIYAEVSVRFQSIEDVEKAIPTSIFPRLDLPLEAAFLAGKAFLRYRKQGGTRRSPLSDFFIGAHAAVSGLRLATRDTARYQTYFPTVPLIAP